VKTTSLGSRVLYLSIRVLFFVICLSSVLLALYLFRTDYRLLDTAFRSYFPNLHEHPDTARLSITPLRLFLLVITCGLIAFVSGLAFIHFPQQAQTWRAKIRSWAESQKSAVRSLLKEIEAMPTWQKYAAGGILLSSLAINLYRSSWSSYDGDEVYSCVYFVHNGWLTTLCHYPDTNNHVFFNLLCIPLDALFSKPAWVLRLVPILAHLALLSAIFLFVKRYFGFCPAFVAMSMGAFWLPTSFYGSIGRGHELMSLFALIGIFHMYAYTLRFQSRNLVTFVGVSVLAFYTVPTYIHCFMSVCAFGLYEGIRQGHWRCVGRIIKAGLFTVLGTVMLYWPIILFSGIDPC